MHSTRYTQCLGTWLNPHWSYQLYFSYVTIYGIYCVMLPMILVSTITRIHLRSSEILQCSLAIQIFNFYIYSIYVVTYIRSMPWTQQNNQEKAKSFLCKLFVYNNVKQKHPGCKKCARPIRSSIANRYVRPKILISVEAKKLLIKNLFNYLNDIQQACY